MARVDSYLSAQKNTTTTIRKGKKMTDVNIKELLAKSDADLRTALEAMLPKPTYPAHLLGLWAKHPEYGDVMCAWDKPCLLYTSPSPRDRG